LSYAVKEIYVTLQGEGAQTGARAVFLRFAGCNLWTGREADRAEAVCRFCDTDFVGMNGPGGGRFAATALAQVVARAWGPGEVHRFVVCTGGEPLLQLDPPLIAALHSAGFRVAVESNGTIPAPPAIDWLTISPKAGADTVQRAGDELKLVFPQPELMPNEVEGWNFAARYLQPMDGPDQAANTVAAAAWCLAHPEWRLSLQTHKLIGLR